MSTRPIVLDTNILVSALRSRNGFSFKLFERVLARDVPIAISTPLVLEYESTLKHVLVPEHLTLEDVDILLDYVCLIGYQAKIYYLWRPFLKDVYDDHILELAVAAGAAFVVTFNTKDFLGIEQFGLKTIYPKDYLKTLGGTQ